MTKSSLSWQNVKSEIKELTYTELLSVVADLYALNKENQLFLHTRYAQSQECLAPYKAIIRKALHPEIERNQGIELSVGRKAIRDYKKAVGNLKNMLELMVYYVECGNDFTLKYGDIGESFYDSLVSMFSESVTSLAVRVRERSDTRQSLDSVHILLQKIDEHINHTLLACAA